MGGKEPVLCRRGITHVRIYKPVGLAIAGLGVLVVVVMVLPLVYAHPSLVIV